MVLMAIPTDKKPVNPTVGYGQKPPRQYASSNLSSNYIKFHKTQFIIVALTLAIIGAGAAALTTALSAR